MLSNNKTLQNKQQQFQNNLSDRKERSRKIENR